MSRPAWKRSKPTSWSGESWSKDWSTGWSLFVTEDAGGSWAWKVYRTMWGETTVWVAGLAKTMKKARVAAERAAPAR